MDTSAHSLPGSTPAWAEQQQWQMKHTHGKWAVGSSEGGRLGVPRSSLKRGGWRKGKRLMQDTAEHEKSGSKGFFCILFEKRTYSFQILMGKHVHPWGNLQAAWDTQQRWSICEEGKENLSFFISSFPLGPLRMSADTSKLFLMAPCSCWKHSSPLLTWTGDKPGREWCLWALSGAAQPHGLFFIYAGRFSKITLSYLYVQELLCWSFCHRPHSYLLCVGTTTKPGVWLMSKALVQTQRSTDFSYQSHWKGPSNLVHLPLPQILLIQKGKYCLPSAKHFWTNEKCCI